MSGHKKAAYAGLFLGGLLLYLITVLPLLIRHGGTFFYYGDYNVQQVPFYIMAHRAAREGRFFWNPLIDLGSSMGGAFSFYLWGSPFFWLTLPFPESWIPGLMPVLMGLKYGTAMVTSFAWIRTQTRSGRGALIGALLYTFSGFQACNIVFQHFHDVTAFFPLYLLAFDRFLEKKDRLPFALMTALMSVISYYFFFGQVLFLVLYYLVRYLPLRSPRRALSEVSALLAWGALGLCLSAFFLVQSLAGVLGNSRLSDRLLGYDLLVWPDSGTPLAILKSMFMVPDLVARQTLFSNENIRNGSLSLYLPGFAMTGVAAFGLRRRKSWKTRLTLVCLVMAFVPVLNALFSALNRSYYARWFYMPLLVMACMSAQALEEGETVSLKKGFGLSVLAFTAFTLAALVPTGEKEAGLFAVSDYPGLLLTEVLATGLMLAGLILAGFPGRGVMRKGQRRMPVLVLVTLLCCLVTTEAVLHNGDSLIALSGGEKWEDQMLGQAPDLPEDGFYRVETDSASTNYEMVWGIPTIHCFLSTVHPSIFSFYRTIGMLRSVESTLPQDRIGARALLSVRFYLDNTRVAQSEDYTSRGGIPAYQLYGDSRGYDIYENPYCLPMGLAFDRCVTREDYALLSGTDLADRLLVRDLIVTADQAERYQDILTLESHGREEPMDMASFAMEAEKRRKGACRDFVFEKNGFSARSSLDRDSLVLFSIPYDRGFSVKVDGEETAAECVDGGLLAVYVPAGDHVIRASYRPPYLVPACLVSLLAALGAVLYAFGQGGLAKKSGR